MTATHSAKSWYRPPHIYQDNTNYFITGSTVDRARYFDSDKKKDILLDVIRRAAEKFSLTLSAWAVLDNHYHILAEVGSGAAVPRCLNNIHANSSRILNVVDASRGRQVWCQYFDRCIRSERDYWVRFNYVHHNCVKHGYVKSMDEYRYSTYNKWVQEKGQEWMRDVLTRYPIVDFSVEGELE